jgi:hypothetical protein
MLLINDDLTGAILLTSCIIGGVLTALVGGCWTFATHRYLTVGVSILSFFIGFFVVSSPSTIPTLGFQLMNATVKVLQIVSTFCLPCFLVCRHT